ncbi:predicted protein [Plenodomus lingam JN3]|uniref:Predicted protein n=1 Tax=Leptosphaeria maculans (strain JN3 / isolate v23.1.3 / race Av1-4-5-6-7-8) TaxID=985895 RepID=E5R4U0_LEPMJ|nr:predicted protein [Plenodomus lingam JN3]CBX92213.1 predicted protein [Plenodomus lingam JN3]
MSIYIGVAPALRWRDPWGAAASAYNLKAYGGAW